MKVKTSELIGPALDWAVASIEGVPIHGGKHIGILGYSEDRGDALWFLPSTDWSQGGPIIEREKITVGPCDIHEQFRAYTHIGCYAAPTPRFTQDGPTPLIAAMRCYVASKLGDEVEIPEELK